MGFLGIIPDEVINEFSVEVIRLVQDIGVLVSKLFRHRPVEAFQVAVGLGVTGVVEVVHHVLFTASLGEMFFELMPIISLPLVIWNGATQPQPIAEKRQVIQVWGCFGSAVLGGMPAHGTISARCRFLPKGQI